MFHSQGVLMGQGEHGRSSGQSNLADSKSKLSTAIEKAHAAMAQAHSAFVSHLADIPHERYSDEGVREAITGFVNSRAARNVDLAVDQVRQRRDQAQNQLDKVREELSPDGDTAAELRAGRFWNRAKGLLDSVDGNQVLVRARSLIANASPAERGTLLQELAPYLSSRGQAIDWIDSAVAEIVPAFSQAREQLRVADQALQIAKFNANALRRGFAAGRPPSVIVDARKYDPDRIG